MKFSFSTLGCPQWLWTEIVSAAVDLGYDGIELRGGGDDLFVSEAKLFAPDHLPETLNALKRKNIKISCVSTDCRLHERDEKVLDEVRGYIALAAGLEAPYIRLLGDTYPAPSAPVDHERVTARLRALAPEAARASVCLLLESNGVFARTERLAATLAAVNHPAVGALWDVHHPFRFFGEVPQTSYTNLKPYVKHIHVKDSVGQEDGTVSYRLFGYGDVPFQAVFTCLQQGGYDGFISLEWTKRNDPGLEDAGIVFPQFIRAVRSLWALAEKG